MTKAAVAQNILHLTQLSEEQKNPNNCLRYPTLWLALSSMCILEKDHVDRLSSGMNNITIILCTLKILNRI